MADSSKKPNVTLSDVAARAGVSRMTASKALRNTGSISTETKERIRLAVEELGYVKNSLAGLLSSQKSEIVGIIIPSASDSVFAEILSGTNSILRPKNLSTFIGETIFDPEIEYQTLCTMMSLQPAGVIISGGVKRLEKTSALIEQRRCPVISIWDQDNEAGDLTLGLSHRAAGRLIAEHFIERGYQTIGYVGSELNLDLCADLRMQGFEGRLAEAGIFVRREVSETAPRKSPSGRDLTKTLLQKHPDIQAIFYLNDAMAIGGLTYLYDTGTKVPQQVAVAGFNGTSIDYTVQTKLTTIDVPRRAIGIAAASALLGIVDPSTEIIKEDLAFQFCQGNTT